MGDVGVDGTYPHASAHLTSLVTVWHPRPALIGTHFRDLDRGMGHVECADGRDIGDANVQIARANMATKCPSVGQRGSRPS